MLFFGPHLLAAINSWFTSSQVQPELRGIALNCSKVNSSKSFLEKLTWSPPTRSRNYDFPIGTKDASSNNRSYGFNQCGASILYHVTAFNHLDHRMALFANI